MEIIGGRFALPRSYLDSVLLHYRVPWYVSEEGFSLTGELLDVRSKWSSLKMWQKNGDWLILTPYVLPQLFFKVSDLEKAGIYNELVDLVKRNSFEFNSAEARRANKLIERRLSK